MQRLKGTRAGLLVGLGLIAMVSQFFRSSLGVIAPELVRDLALSPQTLGLAVLTGAIAGLFSRTETGYPAEAYRWIFLFMALGLACGLAVYTTAQDLKPRPTP